MGIYNSYNNNNAEQIKLENHVKSDTSGKEELHLERNKMSYRHKPKRIQWHVQILLSD